MPTYRGLVSFRVRDETGDERNITSKAEITVTSIADLETLLENMAQTIDAPLLGRVIESSVTLDMGVGAGVKPSPQAGSFVGDGATISFQDSEGNGNPVFFPTMAASKYVGRGALNTDDAEVAALIALFTETNTNGTANLDFTDDDNRKYEQVVPGQQAVIKAFRTTRKYRGKG